MLLAPGILFYAYLRQFPNPRRIYAAFAITCPFIFLLGQTVLSQILPIPLPVLASIILLVVMAMELFSPRFGITDKKLPSGQ